MATASSPTLEKKRWYKNSLAMIAIVGAFAGAIYAIVQLAQAFRPDPEPIDPNIEIVLDCSEAMAEPMGAGTRLDTAVAAVTRYTAPRSRDNLALRSFGGSCDRGSKLVVEFARDNSRRIARAAARCEPQGSANLARAVIEATGDFADLKRFPESVTRKIVVVTAAGDTCEADPSSTIRDRLRELRREITLEFLFVGVGVPPAREAELREIARVTGGEARFAQTAAELDEALGATHKGVRDDPPDAEEVEPDGATPFVDDFESGSLVTWTSAGRGGHSGKVVEDPLRPGNRVLTFTTLNDSGDIYGPEIAVAFGVRYLLSFDYLGLAGQAGVPDNLGGAAGVTDGYMGKLRWLAGTAPAVGIEDDLLVDDGSWHSYSIDFEPPAGAAAIRVALQDRRGSGGEAGDAFFDNVRLQTVPTMGLRRD